MLEKGAAVGVDDELTSAELRVQKYGNTGGDWRRHHEYDRGPLANQQLQGSHRLHEILDEDRRVVAAPLRGVHHMGPGAQVCGNAVTS